MQRSEAFRAAAEQFPAVRGYLNAASTGLPPRAMLEAVRADLETWSRGEVEPGGYDGVVSRTRASYARLVGTDPSRVAIGALVSQLVGLFAAAAPAGAEIVVPHGDFSSIPTPFEQRGDLRVRTVPLGDLAEAIGPETWLVAFSLVQSADGAIADADAIRAAARRHGTLTLVDLTQAAGVLPVNADEFDATVCHAYKWLCSPRGVSFLTIAPELHPRIPALQSGWYAGRDIWASAYGPGIELATDARRYDASPAWQAWVGAEASIGMIAGLDPQETWDHAAELGAALTTALGLPEQRRAIVAWRDESGEGLAKLRAAGIRAAGRAGNLRLSFHLWNDERDVELALAALRG
ncbi:MAG: aminotransferase class V-fold PLP-dependent enzyme [Actinomycetales bacterium]|nr:aminotransferase class V-fold PLP-dependent enzyme [Actinomycetales bacterium]